VGVQTGDMGDTRAGTWVAHRFYAGVCPLRLIEATFAWQ
jgi:hypothetical protein